MKTIITKEKRSFLLVLPLIVLPFLCLVFHTMGGGRGMAKTNPTATMGLNTQLPMLPFDASKAFQDKVKAYEQAEQDSARRRQYQRQDPYRRDTTANARPARIAATRAARPEPAITPADQRADQLMQQLDRLRQSLHQKQPISHPALPAPPAASAPVEEPAPDPQIERLNTMLDKVIRIQHPQEQQPQPASTPSRPTDAILPADSGANSIAAIIPEDQTLTAGTTIAFRITDPIRVNDRIVPAGQLVYGTVTINNDRMLVHIGSVREDRNIYPTDLQVYDLDGLPGIHIPGLLGREVAKQSADQGVSSLNLMTLSPSLGAQAAGAGIQAGKTLLSRKVRQVRVTVRAGYAVLLRSEQSANTHPKPSSLPLPVRVLSSSHPIESLTGPALARCYSEGMELSLRAIGILDSCLWFGLEWRNHSPIVYFPAYARWYVRDRRVFRRTAQQEEPLEAISTPAMAAIGKDSAQHSWTGFRPFALPKSKELVLEVGEKDGGRVLTLIIHSNQLLNAKDYGQETRDPANGATADPIQ